MNDELRNIIISALGLLITGLLGWAITQVTEFLAEKTTSARIKNALCEAEEALKTAVASIMQTYVNELKESGEWTDETAETARQNALLEAQKLMGPLAWKLLNEFLRDDGEYTAAQWCLVKIDSIVESVKLERAQRKALEAQTASLAAATCFNLDL